MKKLKLICKGVLLYVTIFAVMLWVSGIDSIYDNGYFIHSIITIGILIFLCYKFISEKELKVLILDKYFNKGENNN